MKYTVRKSVIRVVGKIWMPAINAAHQYTLSDYDVENCKDDQGNITRQSVDPKLRGVISITLSVLQRAIAKAVTVPEPLPNSNQED